MDWPHVLSHLRLGEDRLRDDHGELRLAKVRVQLVYYDEGIGLRRASSA